MSPIEQAARALCMADYAPQWERLGKDGPKLIDENWPFYVSRVRAVVESIKIPTEDMIDVGVAEAHGKNWGAIVANCYTAMVGSILKAEI